MAISNARLVTATWTLAGNEEYGLYVHEKLVIDSHSDVGVHESDGAYKEVVVNSDTKVNGCIIVRIESVLYMLTIQNQTVCAAIALEEGLITHQKADINWRDELIGSIAMDGRVYEVSESKPCDETETMSFLNIED